ncbi:MAG TPA: hypothetical protein VHP31_02770 [Caproicibacter sp.]|nr:hypothetical protein [Caproicibacter sp.]
MDLLNKKVKHKMLGVGTVVTQDDRYIIVEFAIRTSKFSYPSPNTFTKFLQAEEPAVQAAILQEIADAKALEDAEKRVAEEAKQRAEDAQARMEAQRTAETAAKKPVRSISPKKVVAKQERIPGKRMTFFVFQGNTYDRESRGGYIWAPISNKAGNTFHHWDRLLDVRQGDIILHGYNGYIQAVSTARGECYKCKSTK